MTPPNGRLITAARAAQAAGAATALIAAAAGTASAQVLIYGTIDAAAGRLSNQNPGPPTTGVTRVTGVHNKVLASGVTGKRRTTSLGYTYALSKRTDLYTFAMTEKFPVVGPAAKSGESYVVGIRQTF